MPQPRSSKKSRHRKVKSRGKAHEKNPSRKKSIESPKRLSIKRSSLSPTRKKTLKKGDEGYYASSSSGDDSVWSADAIEEDEEPQLPTKNFLAAEGEDWGLKYGFVTPIDRLYQNIKPTVLPRTPTPQDATSHHWVKKTIPKSIDEILGNEAAIKIFQKKLSEFAIKEKTKFFGNNNIIVYGNVGSGKTSAISAFLHELFPKTQELSALVSNGVLLQLNAVAQSVTLLVESIHSFMKKKDPSTKKKYYIEIDNYHAINLKDQNSVRIVIEGYNRRGARFLITTTTLSVVLDKLQSISDAVEMTMLSEELVLKKVLTFFQQDRIGYVKPAVEFLLNQKYREQRPCTEQRLRTSSTRRSRTAISSTSSTSFTKANELTIVNVLNDFQKAFNSYHYLSLENIQRYLYNGETLVHKKHLEILELSKPHRRCRICTLLPPCKHLSWDKLFARVERIRNQYPRDRGRITCPTFSRRGICVIYARKGKCAYDHPLDIHDIDKSPLIKRCEEHTLPLSNCHHCNNIELSKVTLEDKIKRFTGLTQQIESETKELSNLKIDLYIHVKKGANENHWGSTKKKYDEKTSMMKDRIAELERDIPQRKEFGGHLEQRIAFLKKMVAKGQSKGMGPGHGSITNKPAVRPGKDVNPMDAFDEETTQVVMPPP